MATAILSFLTSVISLSAAAAQNAPKDYVAAHNSARAECYSGSLVAWNETVVAYARQYAKIRAEDCLLKHSESPPYGENIAMGSGNFSGADAVRMWVGEKKWYHHATNTCSGPSCGHYTQVVWRDSVRIGCARVVCRDGHTVFVTCNYDPRGNWIGQSPY